MNTQDYKEQKKSDSLYFWYKARKNLIDLLLSKQYSSHLESRKILDIGCGTGTELDVLKKYGQVTALDKDGAALDIIKKNNCKIIKGDIEKINLEKNSYNCICCFDILEHLHNDQTTISNIYNSLKPGGHIFFTVPSFQFLYSTHDKYTGHKKRYNKKEMKEILKNSGFKNIKLAYWNFFLFIPITFIRIFKKIVFLKLLKSNNYSTDAKPLNKTINSLLYSILEIDNKIINKNIKLPIGLSIYGSAKK